MRRRSCACDRSREAEALTEAIVVKAGIEGGGDAECGVVLLAEAIKVGGVDQLEFRVVVRRSCASVCGRSSDTQRKAQERREFVDPLQEEKEQGVLYRRKEVGVRAVGGLAAVVF